MEKERMGAYPKPDVPDWENKYRYAFAKDDVYSLLMSRIQAWSKEAEDIATQEEQPVKTIV